MTREKFFSSEDEFQKWLFFQSDELESFIKEFDCLDLDYSPESLVQLEQWILKRYSSPKSFIKDEKAEVIDAMIRYVGQVYVKHFKWIWDIELKDQQYVFYSMPLVKPKDDKDNIYAESPFSLLVASTDRRIGDYMYRMFMNMKKEMGKRD